MGNSHKKKILLLAGSTYIFIIGSLLGLIGLILVIIFWGYQGDESESSAERTARRRPDLITFDDLTSTPITEAGVASDQTTQPMDVSTDVTTTNTKTDIASPSPTLTSTSNPTTNVPTSIPTATLTPTSLPSATLTPTPTPTLTPTPTNSPTATPTSTKTPTPIPGSIAGRVLLNGVPEGGVTIKLEDQAINSIAQAVSGSDGTYTFANLKATGEGYNLVMAHEWNTQYELDQVISWGWLGPIPVKDGMVSQIPDFDISLLGFAPTTPAANTSFSAVSSSNPILFEWASYPGATKYWVDLAQGQNQNIVWRSPILSKTSVNFNGTLTNGSQIQPGEYWWGVGARRDLGTYKLTVYGYLPVFLIVP